MRIEYWLFKLSIYNRNKSILLNRVVKVKFTNLYWDVGLYIIVDLLLPEFWNTETKSVMTRSWIVIDELSWALPGIYSLVIGNERVVIIIFFTTDQ